MHTPWIHIFFLPVFPLLVTIFLLYACHGSIEEGKKIQTPDEQQAATGEVCSEGSHRCQDAWAIQHCEKSRWRVARVCPFDRECSITVGDAQASCIEPKRSCDIQATDLHTQLAEFLARPTDIMDPVCRMLDRRLTAITEETDQALRKNPASTLKVSLNECESLQLMNCAFRMMATTFVALELPAGEGASVHLSGSGEGRSYQLSYRRRQSSKELSRENRVEILLTSEAGRRSSLPAPIVGLTLEGLSTSLLAGWDPGYPALSDEAKQSLIETLQNIHLAMKSFYRRILFQDVIELCLAGDTRKQAADRLPGLMNSRNLPQCLGPCREDAENIGSKLTDIVRRRAEQPQTPIHLSPAEKKLLGKGKGLLVCGVMAKLMSISKTLEKPLIPSQQLDMADWFELMSLALPADEYLETLLSIIAATPPSYISQLDGFAFADRMALRRLFDKRLSAPLKSVDRMALIHWARKDSREAVGKLMEAYPSQASRPELQRLYVDLIARYGEASTGPFLSKRLESGDISPEALQVMLLDRSGRKATIDLLRTRLNKLDSGLVLAVLGFAIDQSYRGSEEQPKGLLSAIENLYAETDNFEVFLKCNEVLGRYAGRDWGRPDRPAVLHAYLRGSFTEDELAAKAEATKTALDGLDGELLLTIFEYSRILPPGAEDRLIGLLAALSESNPVILKLSRRLTRMKESPKTARLAAEVLHKSKP